MQRLLSVLILFLSSVPSYSQVARAEDRRIVFAGVPELRIVLDSGHVQSELDSGKTVKWKCGVNLINANGSSFPTNQLFAGKGTINGRGNTTWTDFPEKPYTLALTDSLFAKKLVGLFGLPPHSKWTLLTDYQDKTFIRTAAYTALSYCVGLKWASRGAPVELYINNDYRGLYRLTEKVEADTGRIAITAIKKTDSTLPNISGGYVIEHTLLDQINVVGGEKYFTSSDGGNWTFKVPDPTDITPAQLNWIHAAWDDVLNRIYNVSFSDTVNGYRAVLDVPSAAKFFVHHDLMKAVDMYRGSWYASKARNGKFIHGPVWDAGGSMAVTNFTGYPDDAGFDFSDPIGRQLPLVCPYMARLLQDTFFASAVQREFNAAYADMNQMLADIRPYTAALYATGAVARDRAKWPGILTDPWYLPQPNYEAEIDKTYNFLARRLYDMKRSWYDVIPPKPANVKQ